jgi:spermidine synthase
MLAVVTGFFAGLALGSFLLDGPVSRSRRPGLWYAGLEGLIGLWALVLMWLLPAAREPLARWVGPHPSAVLQWSTAFLVPLVVLLPATVAMGGTLPAMDRVIARLRRNGRCVGGVYAANTLGAVVGTMAATFWLIPATGYRLSLILLAGVNFFCAAVMLTGFASGEPRRGEANEDSPVRLTRARLWLTLPATGLLGIGFELMVVRAISQVLENTIYTYAVALSIYLLGTAAGAGAYQKWLSARPGRGLTDVLAQALAGLSLVSAGVLYASWPIYDGVRDALGRTMPASILAEAVLAVGVFLLPTVVMGALFSHLAQEARQSGGGVGRAVGVNMVGGALAGGIFGLLLIPAIGLRWSLVILSLGYLSLARPRPVRRGAVTFALAVAAVLLGVLGPDMRFVRVGPDARVVAFGQGTMASTAVTAEADGSKYLYVNGFRMGGTRSRFPDWRQGKIPLLLHRRPRSALFLGLGTGATFAAAADFPDLRARSVELIPEILPLLEHFTQANRRFEGPAHLTIHVADARRYVLASVEQYDVIVADLFHPSRDGAGSLYTVEHFQAVRNRLAADGLFCQWLPVYQLDAANLKTIVRSFLDVFPEATGWLCHYNIETPMLGLIGSTEPLPMGEQEYAARVERGQALARAVRQVRLETVLDLAGCFLGGPGDLRNFAGDGPMNTDDRPVVLFEAPRFAYLEPSPAWPRLRALMEASDPDPAAILDDETQRQQLVAYWRARDLLLAALARWPDREATALLRRSLHASRRFEYAYFFLLQRVWPRVHKADPPAAKRLLEELRRAHPHRPEAARLLQRLTRRPPQP